MVPLPTSVRSFGLLTALLALALMAPGTGIVQAGELPTHDSLLLAASLEIAMSPQEKAEHEIRVPPKKPGKKKGLTKKEKLDLCAQDPQCRATLEAANKGKHPQPVPPVTPGSPEDKSHPKSLPPKAKGQGPQSEILLPSEPSLLSWLNPFSVAAAEAQTAPPGFPHRAEAPWYMSSNPQVLHVRNYGGLVSWGNYYLHTTWPGPSNVTTIGKNYIVIAFTAPQTGYYIVDVDGTPARAHIRVPYNGTILHYPDFSNRPAGEDTHFVHIHYLAQGFHYFYFWIDAAPGGQVRVDAVEVDFYR
jgi:hypothetical protein